MRLKRSLSNLYISLLSLLVFITLAPQALAGNEQRLKSACTETVNRYAVHRDALDATAYALVFSEQAVFKTPSQLYEGRNDIRGYINSRSRDISTVHHITTTHIQPVSRYSAEGTVYALVHFYSAKTELNSAKLLRVASAVYHDKYTLSGGRCYITQRVLDVRFIMPLAL